jgi:hypothetical protein
LTGCVPIPGTAGPQVGLGLIAVQRPQDVAERWGEYTLEPADSSGFAYEDQLLSLVVVPLAGSFQVRLENRTEYSIRFLWADAAYVGPDGISTGVVPGETRWADIGNTPGSQTIPAQAAADLSILPRATTDASEMELLRFYDDRYTCETVPGTTIRLMMPIEIQGVTNEYSLMFEPREIGIVQTEHNEWDGVTREVGVAPCSLDATGPARARKGSGREGTPR